MNIFPAIDLYGGKAVRLYKGDYAQMTVYNEDPTQVARDFQAAGANCMHLVDLEGAKTGIPANLPAIRVLREAFDGFIEVGGGIRTLEIAASYLEAGVDRVILGTAAVTDPAFLQAALMRWGGKVAVGVDLKDGFVAIKGWTQTSNISADNFFAQMQDLGVTTVICTIQLIASGGVSSLEDVAALREMGLYGAIIGKAYYIGAIDLKTAIEVAK